MSNDDFSHGILTDIKIIFIIFLENRKGIYLFLGLFSNSIFICIHLFSSIECNHAYLVSFCSYTCNLFSNQCKILYFYTRAFVLLLKTQVCAVASLCALCISALSA